MPDHQEQERQALNEARRLVRDLFEPRAAIYWPDFLLHISVAWAVFIVSLNVPVAGALWWGCLLVAVFSFYRALIFIHELSHLRPGALPGFRLVWNMLCGCLLLVPSFTYSGVHNHHHKQAAYGTLEDGEYLPFGQMNLWASIGFLLSGILTPLAVILRFTLLAPLSWLIPPLRPLLWRFASSLSIDFRYQRGHSNRDDRYWRWQEVACWAWSTLILALIWQGILAFQVLWTWAVVVIGVFLVNGIRTLVAHRYCHVGDGGLSMLQQFHDSVDVPGQRMLTSLWAPVGLRYHATHHLFPSMPYHNLGRAHRRLSAQLSDPSWYLYATEPSLWHALRSLWRNSRSAQLSSRQSAVSPRV